MAHKFAREQPQGLKNHVEKVTIVGVSRSIIVPASASKTQSKLKLQTGWWHCRQIHHRRAPQSRKAQNHRPYPPRQHEHNSRRRRNQNDRLRRPSIPHRSASGPGRSNHHNGNPSTTGATNEAHRGRRRGQCGVGLA